MSWQPTDFNALAEAVAEFERDLPGWWWSVGSCSVSADASCGPDIKGSDAALLTDRLFDSGFHCDYLHPASVADSLREVKREALEARAKALAAKSGGAS